MGRKLDAARGAFKAVDYAAKGLMLGVVADTLKVGEPVSGLIKETAQKIVDTIPDLVTVSANVPDTVSALVSNTEIAKNIDLLLDLGGVSALSGLMALTLKIIGAQRTKIEKVVGGVVKLGGAGVLAHEALVPLFGGKNFDAFRFLSPLLTPNGGDTPSWLVNGNTRVLAWSVSVGVASVLLGAWAYWRDFRSGVRKRNSKEVVVNEGGNSSVGDQEEKEL